MASIRPRYIGQGPSEGQPQWQQWKWHKDEGGGGERSPSIRGIAEAKTKGGHFEGEMFQLWRIGPLCILVSFEEKGQG